MNIAEFPLAMLARRGSEAVKTMEFKDIIWDKHYGQEGIFCSRGDQPDSYRFPRSWT